MKHSLLTEETTTTLQEKLHTYCSKMVALLLLIPQNPTRVGQNPTTPLTL